MHRVYIAGTRKSSGKTLFATGLCASLRARGMRVQPFKKGPDYIDPMWLASATGQPCYNLDFRTMTDAELRSTLARGRQADCSIIEGTKGLYDGVATDGSDSNAAMAKQLDTPVLLIVDCEGMTRGIAALLTGYVTFDRKVQLAGVILNQVAGARHEQKLRAAVDQYCDLPVLGSLPRRLGLGIAERHLGLIPCNESAQPDQQIAALAAAVRDGVDIDAITSIAARASRIDVEPPAAQAPPTARIKLGVLRDQAFGFYYPDDLQSLERAGAELVFVDAQQQTLPPVHGLFIGGGFPETQAPGLQANRVLREQIRLAIDEGLPVYAECGGLMYLCRTLTWRGERTEMVGAIPADCVVEDRPQGRGYTVLQHTGDQLWQVASDGAVIHAHEFHYSRLIDLPEDLSYAYRVTRGHGIDGQRDGLVFRNVQANYVHLRNTRQSPWVASFVNFVAAVSKTAPRPCPA
jgi:cobyrinic acid a,c-diamide synthase